jgi:hypothetical protein
MRNLISVFIVAVLVTACAGAPRTSPITTDAKRVLILSPQGVDPSKDTVGFNALVKNVTQTFSEAFSEQLSRRGLHAVNVLDQQPAPDAGQKMALYSVKSSAAKVAIVTIETKSVGADVQLQLRLQFIEGEFIPSNTAPKGLRVRTTVEKSYVLRGSQSGDTSLSMSDIAKDFAEFVENSGCSLAGKPSVTRVIITAQAASEDRQA